MTMLNYFEYSGLFALIEFNTAGVTRSTIEGTFAEKLSGAPIKELTVAMMAPQ
jgi:hypothetical protein